MFGLKQVFLLHVPFLHSHLETLWMTGLPAISFPSVTHLPTAGGASKNILYFCAFLFLQKPFQLHKKCFLTLAQRWYPDPALQLFTEHFLWQRYRMDTQSSPMARQIKNPGLSLKHIWSLLWHGLIPGPGMSTCCVYGQSKNQKKTPNWFPCNRSPRVWDLPTSILPLMPFPVSLHLSQACAISPKHSHNQVLLCGIAHWCSLRTFPLYSFLNILKDYGCPAKPCFWLWIIFLSILTCGLSTLD